MSASRACPAARRLHFLVLSIALRFCVPTIHSVGHRMSAGSTAGYCSSALVHAATTGGAVPFMLRVRMISRNCWSAAGPNGTPI